MNDIMIKRAGVAGSAAFVLILLTSGPAAALYSGGAGTEPNPYRIANAGDWTALALTTEDWDKYFLLTNDIDFGGDDITPVGTSDAPFTGAFDGNGHVLRDFRIDFPEAFYIGLFCVLGADGEIRDLGVEGAHISGHRYVGALLGRNNGGTVTSCYTTGTVAGENPETGTLFIGGFAGENNGGTVTSCFSTCTVTAGFGSNHIGGLVGRNTDGTLQTCYATGAVNGTVNVGGLAGLNNGGTITSCCAMGAVAGSGPVGGLVGYNNAESSISLCYSTAAVSAGGTNSGGLVGNNYGDISYCYARGVVAGESVAGGLVGQNTTATVRQCYSTGGVTGNVELGGLIAVNTGGTITACYWDTDLSGQTESDGGTGRTTGEMTHPHATNTYVGWNFLATWAYDTDYTVNNGYPYLRQGVVPAEGEPENEGDPPEGEGEGGPSEGEGEVEPGEGELEGEFVEGETEGEAGEGEEEACGCCQTMDKNLSPREQLQRTLGDWLLAGLGLSILLAANRNLK